MDTSDTDNLENILNDDVEEDEIELTPGEVIELMEEAWMNEKFAPEILPNKFEIVECLLGQITYMEENLSNLESTDFKKSIHQLEVDRLRFLVSSYLRTRLEKIELYCNHIMKQETERMNKGIETYLTENELKFLKEYIQATDQHFESVTNFTVVTEDWKNQPVIPNIHSFVFLKSKENVTGVIIDDGNDGEQNDVADLEKGSQLIISYNSVSNLIKKGDVHLL
ncbi:DNA replication complex GINS protein SLD5 [Aethina tumida]|uniref:DNA replication complex GINS protein SLD5 n=1 Tax=Aethina tumida TaxID=116153 RepID=UPI0021473066|nr:DNA replication complex GINS protein SLD5 [Aethina tumida]